HYHHVRYAIPPHYCLAGNYSNNSPECTPRQEAESIVSKASACNPPAILFPVHGVTGAIGGKFTVSCNWLFIKRLRWLTTRCDIAGFAVQYGYTPLSVEATRSIRYCFFRCDCAWRPTVI